MDDSRIESIVKAFMLASEAGLSPDIGRMLDQVPENLRERLFGRLVSCEIDLSKGRGEEPVCEAYLVLFPEYARIVVDCFQCHHSSTPSADGGLFERSEVDGVSVWTPDTLQVSPACQEWSSTSPLRRELRGSENDGFREGFGVDECESAAPPNTLAETQLPGGRSTAKEASTDNAVPQPLADAQDVECLRPVIGPALQLQELRERLMAFEFHSEIGSGGQGAVYHASRRGKGEQVAVKVLSGASQADPKVLSLFMREASVLSRLRHKRIVQFHEVGQVDGVVYLVMEYVNALRGESMLEWRTTPRGRSLLCGIICQVLEALVYLHGQGVVHRDIKPSNILVKFEQGKYRAFLTDFGLAKCFETAGYSGFTCSSQFRGTLAYVSPEQFMDSCTAGPPADIYSTGATLYYYLSGQPPFAFETLTQAIALLRTASPTPLVQHCPDLPADLVAVIERAMNRDAEQRFPTARDMYGALLPFAKRGASSRDS